MSSSDLPKRAATGVVGILGLVSLIVYGGYWGVGLFTLFLALGSVFEFGSMVFHLKDAKGKRLFLVFLGLVAAFLFEGVDLPVVFVMSFGFLSLFLVFLFGAKTHQESPEDFKKHLQELMFAFFGFVYLACVPWFFPALRRLPHGVHWVMMFLVTNWAIDIAAYFVGRSLGRRKLYPLISPKKSVEGAVGGFLAAFVALFSYRFYFFPELPVFAAAVAGLTVGFLAQVGDLAESFLKRGFETKDSGALLPGHGGLMDRFDGVVFSVPVYFAVAKFFT